MWFLHLIMYALCLVVGFIIGYIWRDSRDVAYPPTHTIYNDGYEDME